MSERTRAVGYIRVSTDRQADEGGGLDVQRDSVTAYAKAHDLRLVQICEDAGVSGAADAVDRDGLACVLELVESGDAGVVIVARLDRLARDVVVQESLLRTLAAAGAVVKSCSDGENANLADDPADPSRRMIRVILGAVSEYEREIIALRMRVGRARKRRAGGYAGDGPPPFGYRVVDGELGLDPDETAVLARMRALQAGGSSVRGIATVLNDEGLPSKRGGRWHPTTVARALGADYGRRMRRQR